MTHFMLKTILMISLFINLLASPVMAATSEQRFWKRVDRDLGKQKKRIERDLKKKDTAQLLVSYQRFMLKNFLAVKYNVTTKVPMIEIESREDYALFAGAEYASNFKAAINSQIRSFDSFDEYLETTGEGKTARRCRAKRDALMVGGISALSLAVAGGVILAMLVPNVLAGTAVTIRWWAALMMGATAVGTPGGSVAVWWSQKMHCIGE